MTDKKILLHNVVVVVHLVALVAKGISVVHGDHIDVALVPTHQANDLVHGRQAI
jgi:hypothetical protein